MSTKQKILQALDCALDDLSEDRLLDILLDAYNNKKKEIKQLQLENACEQKRLGEAIESIRHERAEMHSNPLYGATGQYFFQCRGRYFGLQIWGKNMQFFERDAKCDWAGMQITPEEWGKMT